MSKCTDQEDIKLRLLNLEAQMKEYKYASEVYRMVEDINRRMNDYENQRIIQVIKKRIRRWLDV